MLSLSVIQRTASSPEAIEAEEYARRLLISFKLGSGDRYNLPHIPDSEWDCSGLKRKPISLLEKSGTATRTVSSGCGRVSLEAVKRSCGGS